MVNKGYLLKLLLYLSPLITPYNNISLIKIDLFGLCKYDIQLNCNLKILKTLNI